MAGELNLQATLVRDVVNSMDRNRQPQKTYVLLQAAPTGVQIAHIEMPLNLGLVLDRSGSMCGEKIKNLRQAVHALVDLLQPSDVLSIVLFDEMVEVPLPAKPVVDKNALHIIVDRIEERGGTQMSLGLQKGLDQVSLNNDPGRIKKIILLTDGNKIGRAHV
jgi:Ca-activated chloride channel family protein